LRLLNSSEGGNVGVCKAKAELLDENLRKYEGERVG
jgi:hypothetical protein